MLFLNLIDIIPDLLYKHNCVIIPEFGGFITNYKQSGFEENRNLIIPSSKKVAFNQSLVENDGLLVNHWARLKNIPYQDALNEVGQFCNYLKEKIEQNRSFDFKNIGTFYFTNENSLLFVPYQGLNFLESSYGLYPVKIRPVNAIPFTSLNISDEKVEPVQINENIAVLEIIENNKPVVESIPYKINFKPVLKVASIVFISFFTIFGLYFFYNAKHTNKDNNHKAQIFGIDTNSGKTKKSELKRIEIPQYTNERKEIEEIKEKLKKIKTIQESLNETYDVIEGYYIDYKTANRVLEKLKKDFLNAKINEKTESGYSITVETFYTYTTAQGFSVMLKQNGFKNVKIEKNIVFKK